MTFYPYSTVAPLRSRSYRDFRGQKRKEKKDKQGKEKCDDEVRIKEMVNLCGS